MVKSIKGVLISRTVTVIDLSQTKVRNSILLKDKNLGRDALFQVYSVACSVAFQS